MSETDTPDEGDARGRGPRGEHGHLQEMYPESAALRAVASIEGQYVSTGDVADVLGCSGQTARRKCNALVEEGRLKTGKPHPKRRYYWLPEEDVDLDDVE